MCTCLGPQVEGVVIGDAFCARGDHYTLNLSSPWPLLFSSGTKRTEVLAPQDGYVDSSPQDGYVDRPLLEVAWWP